MLTDDLIDGRYCDECCLLEKPDILSEFSKLKICDISALDLYRKTAAAIAAAVKNSFLIATISSFINVIQQKYL